MTPAPHPLRIVADAIALEPLVLDAQAFCSPLPVQHYGTVYEDAAIGLAVGIWDTTTMQEAFGPYPGDEFITVLDGRFAMVDAMGGPLVAAHAGDSVTFRSGVPSSWKQTGYLRKVYLTLHAPDSATPAISATGGGFCVLEPGDLPQGSPDADGATRAVIFRNDAGTMTVTLCSFPAMKLPPATGPCHQLIRVLCGEVALSGALAPVETFGPNDHVFLPKGTTCAMAMAAGTVAIFVNVTTGPTIAGIV